MGFSTGTEVPRHPHVYLGPGLLRLHAGSQLRDSRREAASHAQQRGRVMRGILRQARGGPEAVGELPWLQLVLQAGNRRCDRWDKLKHLRSRVLQVRRSPQTVGELLRLHALSLVANAACEVCGAVQHGWRGLAQFGCRPEAVGKMLRQHLIHLPRQLLHDGWQSMERRRRHCLQVGLGHCSGLQLDLQP